MHTEFFQVVSVQEFLQKVQTFPSLQETEMLSAPDALHRVLAHEVIALENVPAFQRAAMDGYAVQAADTFGSSEANPAYLEKAANIHIGEIPEKILAPGQCASIVTGAALPKGADSVVMQEYAQDLGHQEIEIRRPVAPGENMLMTGEDCKQGSAVLAQGTRLRPQDIALLCALGQEMVQVFARPKVGVISTGDELVPMHDKPGPGQIRDVNTYSIAAWLKAAGFEPKVFGIVPDSLPLLQQTLQQALEQCDLILLSGGSSVGTRDLSLDALLGLPGSEILAHGVAISPGKPTILARLGSKPIIGLPGQVTSVQVVLYVLVLPCLQHISGQDSALNCSLLHYSKSAELARNLSSKQGREDYVRIRLESRRDELDLAVPVLGKSGLLRTMLQAQGLLRIPAEFEGLEQGDRVKVLLF